MYQEIRFYFYSIKKNFENSSGLRAGFIFSIFSMVLNNFSFVVVWYLFIQKIGEINGWGFNEILAQQGIHAFLYGVVYILFGGMTRLSEKITNGSFDKFLISPKNVLSNLSTSYFQTSAIGDTLQGLLCLIFYFYFSQISFGQVILLMVCMFLACLIYVSFLLFINAIAFYIPESTNFIRDIYDLFLSTGLYPGGAYEGWLRNFFIFVIPSLTVSAVPVDIVKFANPETTAILFSLSVFWVIFSYKFFMNGVKNYESSNTYTFGK